MRRIRADPDVMPQHEVFRRVRARLELLVLYLRILDGHGSQNAKATVLHCSAS